MGSLLLSALCAAIVGTSFLSGIFGMAGGVILVGLLFALMPVSDAMMLHGITQLASNCWRGLLWIKHVRWSAAASYIAGCTTAFLLWSLTRYVPSPAVALLLLGLTPFLIRLLPRSHRPNPESLPQGMICGIVCMMLILLTGVSGPLVDTFFLGGKLDRREIVATKAICQVFGHSAKILYFGVLIDQAPSIDPVVCILAVICSMIGTVLAAKVLLVMSDQQYRSWANRIITAIAGYYVVYGTILAFLTPQSAQ